MHGGVSVLIVVTWSWWFLFLGSLDTTQALSRPLPRRAVLGILPSLVLAPTAATGADDVSNVLLGTYTDPINHPGGTRTITLTGTGVGGFQLAEITGGGGRGEPEHFTLPAMISTCPRNNVGASACITIDFSPKGGPRDFTGYWDANKQGIRFPADGNFWPKVSSP